MTFLQNSTINRKSFRHRKVDNKKPLRIYTPGEINEDDCIPVSRAGIEIETGVEKEEEEEWHLVNALKLRTESMEKGATASGKATIPVPTSSRRISYYADVYQTHKWKKPTTYVKFSLPVEECIGCLYCMDEKDDIWLADHRQKTQSTLTEDQFEEIMQHFELVAKNKPQLLAKKQIPSWQDCEICLPESLNDLKDEAEIVYSHWKSKRWERMKQYQKAGPLMFEIKTQEGKDEEDHPWTCFRRRELKPIRRTRRTETASFDKLRRIRKDIHSGRHIMVSVTIREKTKKQKIELDRKMFEKECTARELRKKLGIRNEISHEQPKRRKSSFAMDLGSTKIKSGIKLSKKDDEYPMTDITEFPYLVQRKPVALSFFRKFDSLKPNDRGSISCTAFRSRFGRGGRRRRIIDRLDVFSYRRIRETNERYRYDSDGIDDVFSDDEINQLDDDEEEEEDFTENIIRFHLFKEEDYQNLGVYRRIQKEKQNSPTKQQSLDALTGNNIPAQNPQHTPLANSESRQNVEHRTIESRFASTLLLRSNTESRTQLENRPSQKLDPDRINVRDTRVSNVAHVDPRTFIGVKSANTEQSTRLSSNSPTPRSNNDPRTNQRIVSAAHNGLTLRPTLTTMNHHRDNLAPYNKRPMQRNRIPDDSTNTIGGGTNVANGMTPTSLSSISTATKNHVTTQNTSVAQARLLTSNNGANGNGDGLTRTSSASNPGIITNNLMDATKVYNMNNSGQATIVVNSAGQVLDPKIVLNQTNQIDAQKITQLIKSQRMGNGVQQASTNKAMLTPEQVDPALLQQIPQIVSLRKGLNTNNIIQQINNQNNQRQSVVQTSRQPNISVGSNVPSNSADIVPSVGIVQSSPSTSVMRQNNIVQTIPQSFALTANNGFNMSSGSSNVRQNLILRHMNQNVSVGVNGSQNINVNTNVSLGNGSQTIPNVPTNGSQFVHQGGIVISNMQGNLIATNGQRATSIVGMGGRNFITNSNMVPLNIRQSVSSGNNGSAHLANPVPVNLADLRRLAANGASTRQIPTNSAVRQLPGGFINAANVLAANNGANYLTQRPIMRQSVLGTPMIGLPTGVYDILQQPRQNNVSPANASTSNGGNNSVGTPSPQPQAEQRTVSR